MQTCGGMGEMITEYHFNAETGELLWELQWPEPGVRITVKRSGSRIREVAVMTVKEGRAAEHEMIDWRQHSKLYQPNVRASQMPSWLFWCRD